MTPERLNAGQRNCRLRLPAATKGRAIAGLPSERTQPRLFRERDGGDLHADRLADRDRDLARRRQRRRRRGCGLRRARGRRAAIDGTRRRLLLPLRAARRRQGRRRQRLGPVGGRRFARRDQGRRAQLRQTTFPRTASRSPAPSPAGNCCWTPTGPRASTNCFFPPSAAPRKAFRCISAWPGIGRCTRTSCAAPGTSSSCPAAERRARAIASSRARSPARCAPSPSAAPTPSTQGQSQPTWPRRFGRAAACRRKRISPTD